MQTVRLVTTAGGQQAILTQGTRFGAPVVNTSTVRFASSTTFVRGATLGGRQIILQNSSAQRLTSTSGQQVIQVLKTSTGMMVINNNYSLFN